MRVSLPLVGQSLFNDGVAGGSFAAEADMRVGCPSILQPSLAHVTEHDAFSAIHS